MNIYEYFNSHDIANHCQSIEYALSPTETAYMVWLSDHHTLTEKHRAWQKIIDTMPDEDFHPNCDMKGHTLHSFLQDYMQMQNEYIKDFGISKENYIYTSEILYLHDDIFQSNNMFYGSYESCYTALTQQSSDNDISQIRIIRHRLYSSPISLNEAEECDSIIFNTQMEPLYLEPSHYATNDNESIIDYFNGFYNMWIAIPVPFKKGDIVTVKHTYDILSRKCRPFILEKVPWWRRNSDNNNIKENVEYWLNNGVDWTDMNLCAWFQDPTGELLWDHRYCYLDLEYYRDGFEGSEKFLIAVSNCMQGKIPIEELLKSHSIILMENYAEEMRKHFYHNKEALNACGIDYRDLINCDH